MCADPITSAVAKGVCSVSAKQRLRSSEGSGGKGWGGCAIIVERDAWGMVLPTVYLLAFASVESGRGNFVI